MGRDAKLALFLCLFLAATALQSCAAIFMDALDMRHLGPARAALEGLLIAHPLWMLLLGFLLREWRRTRLLGRAGGG